MTTIKTSLAVLLICLCFSAKAQTKMGFINSLELLSFMPEIKQSDSVLQILAADLQKQYNAYLTEYQQKLADYNQNAATWSAVKVEATEQDLGGMQQRIQDFETTSQQKIETKKQELYDPILKKANEAIQAIGKENKFTCIIDGSAGALIYTGTDMVDLMPLVKTKLNLK